MKSRFKGISEQGGSRANPWRSQITLNKQIVYLGTFPEAEDAARAYDNAAFYAAETGRCRCGKLNFPEEYQSDPPPEANPRTLEIVAELESYAPVRRWTTSQIGFFPDRELTRGLVERLVAARRAEVAVSNQVDRLLAELHARLSISSEVVRQEVALMERLENSAREPWQDEKLAEFRKTYKTGSAPATADRFSGGSLSADADGKSTAECKQKPGSAEQSQNRKDPSVCFTSTT